jgi:hypothetical protein
LFSVRELQSTLHVPTEQSFGSQQIPLVQSFPVDTSLKTSHEALQSPAGQVFDSQHTPLRQVSPVGVSPNEQDDLQSPSEHAEGFWSQQTPPWLPIPNASQTLSPPRVEVDGTLPVGHVEPTTQDVFPTHESASCSCGVQQTPFCEPIVNKSHVLSMFMESPKYSPAEQLVPYLHVPTRHESIPDGFGLQQTPFWLLFPE